MVFIPKKNILKFEIRGTSTQLITKSGQNFNKKVSHSFVFTKVTEKLIIKIQKWWRKIISFFNNINSKLVKIQSNWRGYWIRYNQYDIIYYSLITQTFVEKVNKILSNYNKRDGMDFLIDNFGDKFKKKINVLKFVKLQREIKRILQKKKGVIKSKNDIFGLIKHIVNKNTFKKIKIYYEHRQSFIFNQINVKYKLI